MAISKNIWNISWILQKKVVPLHPLTRNTSRSGAVGSSPASATQAVQTDCFFCCYGSTLHMLPVAVLSPRRYESVPMGAERESCLRNSSSPNGLLFCFPQHY